MPQRSKAARHLFGWLRREAAGRAGRTPGTCYRSGVDVNSTGRTIHALAALRDSNGDVAKAARRLGVRADQVVGAVETGGGALYERLGDGRIMPTQMGRGFADRVSTFPHVSW